RSRRRCCLRSPRPSPRRRQRGPAVCRESKKPTPSKPCPLRLAGEATKPLGPKQARLGGSFPLLGARGRKTWAKTVSGALAILGATGHSRAPAQAEPRGAAADAERASSGTARRTRRSTRAELG